MSFISDITEQKGLERSFQTREAIAILRQQRPVLVNSAFAAMFGYPLKDLSGMNPLDLFCRRNRNLVSTRLTRFPQSISDQHWDAVGVTRQGHEIWLDVEQTTIMWEGQPAIVVTIRDSTAHKLREKRLEEENTLLKQQQLPFNPAGMRFQEAVVAFEKHPIASVLEQHDGHQRKTSEMLDIPPKTLYRKIRKYSLKSGKDNVGWWASR